MSLANRGPRFKLLTFTAAVAVVGVALGTSSCSSGGGRDPGVLAASGCMKCHNGSSSTDYGGPGIENPHPFTGAANLDCVTCHGGDGTADTKEAAHVPPPPQVGDRAFQEQNNAAGALAYFNRLTLAGLDKFPDYTVEGKSWTALDYLQFVNPGDLRIVTKGRSCGACHGGHAECVAASPFGSATGILGGASYSVGHDNKVTANQGLYRDTATDYGFRDLVDPDFQLGVTPYGSVPQLIEYPVFSKFNLTGTGPEQIRNNNAYLATNLPNFLEADGRVVSDSPLARLYHEQVAFTCGDCHLGSAGANNRTGDYRSSGCSACHMPYSLGGRAGSSDPNINKVEPADPDDIDEPERAHVRSHRILSVKQTLPSGIQQEGIDDYACAGCHQGSNRMVMQFWGIRLDQNQDLRRGVQYPAQPVKFTNTAKDTRLFDPQLGNREFNGRNANQYILFEDYDGDNRDDTPEDVHYAAGLGCIDCHGSYDLHGDVQGAHKGKIVSRMWQSVAIRCENCHGTATDYAATKVGRGYDGQQRELAMDTLGNVLKHVAKEAEGTYYLTGRLDGQKHYIPQTKDTIVDNGKLHPQTNQPLYNPKASYAMGRADGNPATGTGPQQTGTITANFSHMDNMSCASCHTAWTNTCMGCHLQGEYNTGNNFSNITGERIVFREEDADFVYQSPVFFQLGIGQNNKIEQVASNTKVFFQYKDRNNVRSQVFAFSDREGRGANPAVQFPSLGHNFLLNHSIRGRVTSTDEGPRYCVACHLTTEGMTNYGAIYDTFRTQMANNDFANLDFNMLRQHIGRNTGNQMNSPIWVHMVAGLGSGLFLFDSQGRPINPLDNDANRQPFNVAPATRFNPALVTYNLDRIVLDNGIATASSNHAFPGGTVPTPNLRDGASDPEFTGPLGATLIRKLTDPTTGTVLDSWIDADGALKGFAPAYVK